MAYSQYYLVEIFGFIIANIVALYFYLKYVKFNYWSNRNIPYVKPAVPFGSLGPVFAGKLSIGEFMRDKYLEFRKSPVFGIYSVHRPTLLINDPDLIRLVLTKDFVNFHDRGLHCDEERDPLSAHLFFLPGPKWRYLRNKLSPTFTSSKMKRMFFIVKESGDTLTAFLADKAKKCELVEVKDLSARFATDVIASAAFGIQCNCIENPDAEFRKWGRKVFKPQPIKVIIALLAPQLLKTLRIPGVDKDVSNFFISIFKETVEYRKANNVERKDFLDLLIQLMNEGSVREVDDNEIERLQETDNEKITMLVAAAQAFIFWLAGFDTSSATVTNCLYELAVNQDIQDKVAEEAKEMLAKYGELTYDGLMKMEYLHKVISETLRKYPVVPMLNRECTKDINLPGVGWRLTEGTSIIIPVFGLHRDPDIYPNPEKFDPERFTEENISSRHKYAYLPFGEGPRNCIGMRFGLIQTKVAVISILCKYRLKPGPDVTVPMQLDKSSVVTGPTGGLSLRIEERN